MERQEGCGQLSSLTALLAIQAFRWSGSLGLALSAGAPYGARGDYSRTAWGFAGDGNAQLNGGVANELYVLCVLKRESSDGFVVASRVHIKLIVAFDAPSGLIGAVLVWDQVAEIP